MRKIGRYELVNELGRGAMGIVYRANDPVIGRTVAIKTIRLGDITDPHEHQRLRERLFREARSAGILSHPNIVTVYDIGEEGEIAYIAMEFVSGSTLEHVMRAETGLEKHVILSVLYETAMALDYAHLKGIVHRDIKPANIMINEAGAVKIADFGVAKILSQQVTQADLVLGTPSYMSPEQIEAKSLDGRSDQFAVAVIAYEMLTGEKPFVGDSLPSLLFKIVKEDHAGPHLLNPSIGLAAGEVFVRALAKKSAARYPTCLEFVQRLTEALEQTPAWRPLLRDTAGSMATIVEPLPAEPADTTAGRTKAAQAAEAARAAVESKETVLASTHAPVEPPPAPPPVVAPARAAAAISPPAAVPVAPAPPPSAAPAEPLETSRPAAAPRARRDEPAAASKMARNLVLAGLLVVLAAAGWFGGRRLLSTAAGNPEAGTAETASQDGGQPLPTPPEPPPPPPPTPIGQPASPPVTPPPADAAKPSTTSQRPAAPGTRLVAAAIETDPPGVAVTFDDAGENCVTPCSMELAAGRHVLRASKAGYRSAVRIFNLPQEASVKIALEREAGQLAIKSNPPDAQIFVNGQLQSKRTPALISLPVGKYKIQLRKEGVRDWEEEVDVADRVIRTIDVTW